MPVSDAMWYDSFYCPLTFLWERYTSLALHGLDLNHFLAMVGKIRWQLSKSVRFSMIFRYSSVMPISELCLKLQVSRSGYYKWLNRRTRQDRDLFLRDRIIAIQQFCDFTVGYHRMVDFLKTFLGMICNHKRVYRVMKRFALLSHVPNKAKYKAIRRAAEGFPNLVNGDFTAIYNVINYCIINSCFC